MSTVPLRVNHPEAMRQSLRELYEDHTFPVDEDLFDEAVTAAADFANLFGASPTALDAYEIRMGQVVWQLLTVIMLRCPNLREAVNDGRVTIETEG